MKKYFVYVISSKIKGLRFYVGMSENVERRVLEHNSSKVKSTKAFVPWELLQLESFTTRKDAREREKYLKGGSGKERIKEKWFRSSVG